MPLIYFMGDRVLIYLLALSGPCEPDTVSFKLILSPKLFDYRFNLGSADPFEEDIAD